MSQYNPNATPRTLKISTKQIIVNIIIEETHTKFKEEKKRKAIGINSKQERQVLKLPKKRMKNTNNTNTVKTRCIHYQRSQLY